MLVIESVKSVTHLGESSITPIWALVTPPVTSFNPVIETGADKVAGSVVTQEVPL